MIEIYSVPLTKLVEEFHLEVAFAAITGAQLDRWYKSRVYCGKCGAKRLELGDRIFTRLFGRGFVLFKDTSHRFLPPMPEVADLEELCSDGQKNSRSDK